MLDWDFNVSKRCYEMYMYYIFSGCYQELGYKVRLGFQSFSADRSYTGKRCLSLDCTHEDNMSMCFIPPYTPLLYSKTGVYMGIHYFLIFALKHIYWVTR